MKTTRARATAGLILLGLLLAGCGGGDEESTASAGRDYGSNDAEQSVAQDPVPAAPAADAAAGAAAADAPVAASAPAAAGSSADGGSSAIAKGAGKDRKNRLAVPDAALTGRDVIYTADLTVRVPDVGAAVSQVESATAAAGGMVANSSRSTALDLPADVATAAKAPKQDRSSAELTLRIPPGRFDSLLDRVAELGTVLERRLTGEDVTDQIVDVDSRITSARASLTRVLDLMDRAGTLRDVVALEGEVAQRQSDLDALLAKQAKLRDRTELTTVTVRLVGAGTALAEPVEQDETTGFVAGLRDGWDAFTAGLVVAATVLGAVLPFAIALLVLGPPAIWATLRTRRMLAAALTRREQALTGSD